MREGPAPLAAREVGASLGGTEVLHGVSVVIPAGCWTALVGPNGAGKSTLLRVLAGLLPATRGDVHLLGQPLSRWSPRERAQRVAWLSQQVAEGPGDLAVQDVVQLGRLPHLGLLGAPGPCDHEAVRQAMEQTECAAWSARRMGSLSGGERQRALLARALAVGAPVLLLDEPTTHLDPPHQVSLVRLLQRLAHEQGIAVASVLHDLPLALQADRLLVMEAGRVRAEGSCDDSAVRAAISEVFGHAVRIERVRDRWLAVPAL
jgi:iron complex transport system ATP-binding protein